MSELVLPVHGADLCVETFGAREDPAVLLIAGMSSPMDWWEDGFCDRLAAGGRYVVRYDFRDTGRSTTHPPGEPGYTAADLRADVVGVLDALAIGQAHLIGVSMGGAVAQVVAVEHPSRVASLTLVDTSAALPGVTEDLPPITPELAAHFETAAGQDPPDWSSPEEVVDHLVAEQRVFMRAGFDEERVRAIARRVVARSHDVAASGNHALLEPGPEPTGRLADIAAQTLVVHGTEDPMFPVPHAEALARAIPGRAPLAARGRRARGPAAGDVGPRRAGAARAHSERLGRAAARPHGVAARAETSRCPRGTPTVTARTNPRVSLLLQVKGRARRPVAGLWPVGRIDVICTCTVIIGKSRSVFSNLLE